MNGQVSQWSTMQVIPKSATVFTVYSLSPDTMYEFKVLARNELGTGNFSEIVQARTKGQPRSTFILCIQTFVNIAMFLLDQGFSLNIGIQITSFDPDVTSL